MSTLCKTCANRNTIQCGSATCQVRLQRTLRAIERHQQRQQEAMGRNDVTAITRHQQAIDRLQEKLVLLQ
ncbi:hypothetical protein [Kistimonas asteriae]|uniref:hypothetical protein n=1 Tax=Kistimonas asteriae TaxID=517724 RepID=UPI001BA74CCC|nr:hypothetical protein [Kistimonas asteriae]